jgi:hypothetical protein
MTIGLEEVDGMPTVMVNVAVLCSGEEVTSCLLISHLVSSE